MADKPTSQGPLQELVDTGREFYRRGWTYGISGNFSVLLARKPMRLCITAAGDEKAALDDTNFLELDDDAEILQGFGRPDDEKLLHLSIYRHRPKARCILYSHSVWGTLLADKLFVDGAITFTGYEIIKGLSGINTHEAIETIPIIENSHDYVAQSHVIQNVLQDAGNIHGIFVRKHGLYTWGETVLDTRRHVEIFEFLFEITARKMGIG